MFKKFVRIPFKSLFSLLMIVAVLVSGLGASAPFHPGNSTGLKSYIVQSKDYASLEGIIARHGGVITSRLEVINGVGALLPESEIASLKAETGITFVTPNYSVSTLGEADKLIKTPSTDYPDVVGADVVVSEGDYGKGVSVAVVDTGISTHPSLLLNEKGRLMKIVGWVDILNGKKLPYDPNGHGTHVAGIIANAEKDSKKEYNGVAPGTYLVGVRVLDQTGAGTYEKVIQGIQWVIDHKDRYNIRVMNLSLVAPVQSAYWADPLNQAVMKAWEEGITVVASAGNSGSGPMSVTVPGNNPYVITVGAFTDNYTPDNWNDDYITPFSSAGPTLDGFVKPDVVAPGAHMVSTMLPGSYIARHHTANWVNGLYYSMAGTSQAAAVVSGIAALVISENPDLTPNQVKYRIMATAFPWVTSDQSGFLYSMWQQGSGRVNAPDAVFADIEGEANAGMDINADLNGDTHYEGYSYFDETTGEFKLRGDYNAYESAYGTWSGAYGTWSGAYGTWSGAYGTWSGAYGTWSGAVGPWAGAYGTWSGAYGTWSGAYGTWSGAYGTWSGGYQNWDGTNNQWAGAYSDPEFAQKFTEGSYAGQGIPYTGQHNFVGSWIEEE